MILNALLLSDIYVVLPPFYLSLKSIYSYNLVHFITTLTARALIGFQRPGINHERESKYLNSKKLFLKAEHAPTK